MNASYSVWLGTLRVGYLSELKDGRWGFQFTPAYRAQDDRPVLGQTFEDNLERVYTGKRPGRLPAFFAHLLPEGQLRGVIVRSLGLEDPTDAELLASVSRDLPGAVRLVRSAATELTETHEETPADGEPASLPGALRFSLGGAQLKFSMLRHGERFTLPAHGDLGSWIVKIASTGYEGLAANEFAMLAWARSSGYDVPEAQLVGPDALGELRRWLEGDSHGLAVRRYDRDGSRRIHQEDFAQVIGVDPLSDGSEKYRQTYDNVVKLTNAIVGREGAEEMLLRIAFVVASGNADAHLKNWSLLYPDGIRAELAPLYDQVSTVAWPRLDRELALKFASSREFGRVRLESFAHLARQLSIDVEQMQHRVRDRVARIREAWPKAIEAGLPEAHAVELRRHWTRVPLLRDVGGLG
jgi:serine/threonine-protein kinase HipA